MVANIWVKVCLMICHILISKYFFNKVKQGLKRTKWTKNSELLNWLSSLKFSSNKIF